MAQRSLATWDGFARLKGFIILILYKYQKTAARGGKGAVRRTRFSGGGRKGVDLRRSGRHEENPAFQGCQHSRDKDRAWPWPTNAPRLALRKNRRSRIENRLRPERDQHARRILGKVSQGGACSRHTAHSSGKMAPRLTRVEPNLDALSQKRPQAFWLDERLRHQRP